MGRLYSVPIVSVAVTAQQDFFEYTAPSTGIVVVHLVELTQSSDVGDAQAEGLSILHRRGATTTGSGGSTVTPGPLEFGSVAAAGVAKVGSTTKASGGTIVTLRPSSWIIQSPYLWLPTPELRHVLAPGQRYTIELATTPADSITVSGELVVEEIG